MISQAVKLAGLIVVIWGITWLEQNTGVPSMIIDGFMALVQAGKTNQ